MLIYIWMPLVQGFCEEKQKAGNPVVCTRQIHLITFDKARIQFAEFTVTGRFSSSLRGTGFFRMEDKICFISCF